ncbi:hypothetical protein M885DRAFT_520238 [Pelagophyceae sp. CCMP2097]|nr:hypothetical protein M885DRAFT_520238 [Pelagophyceae sp. CCMP2097]
MPSEGKEAERDAPRRVSDAEPTTPSARTPELPPWAQTLLTIVKPHLVHALELVDAAVDVAAPFVNACVAAARAHGSYDGAAGIVGLLMCCYGGSFVKLIAVAESLAVTGTLAAVKVAFAALRGHVADVLAADRDDAKRASLATLRDEGDYAKLASRRLGVLASAIKDPAALSATAAALWSAGATVTAALRVSFARTIVLGVSLANIVKPLAMRDGVPLVKSMLAKQHRQWAPTLVAGAVKVVAVALAWQLARVVGAWHSACRGGSLAAQAACRFLKQKQLIPRTLSLASDDAPIRGASGPLAFGFYADELVGFVLAVFGLRMQLVYAFELPLLLKAVLFPAIVAEALLGAVLVGAA